MKRSILFLTALLGAVSAAVAQDTPDYTPRVGLDVRELFFRDAEASWFSNTGLGIMFMGGRFSIGGGVNLIRVLTDGDNETSPFLPHMQGALGAAAIPVRHWEYAPYITASAAVTKHIAVVGGFYQFKYELAGRGSPNMVVSNVKLNYPHIGLGIGTNYYSRRNLSFNVFVGPGYRTESPRFGGGAFHRTDKVVSGSIDLRL